MPASPKKYLTRHEAAEYLRSSVMTIDRRISDGSLRTYALGRRVLIDPDDLRSLLVARGNGGQP